MCNNDENCVPCLHRNCECWIEDEEEYSCNGQCGQCNVDPCPVTDYTQDNYVGGSMYENKQ